MKKVILISALILGGLFIGSSVSFNNDDELLTSDQVAILLANNEVNDVDLFQQDKVKPMTDPTRKYCYRMLCSSGCGGCGRTYWICSVNPTAMCPYCARNCATWINYILNPCTYVSHCH